MTLETAVRRIVRRLSLALPEEFQQSYGSALNETTADAVGAMSRRGGLRLLVSTPWLLLDLVARIVVEHARDAVRDVRYAVRIFARAPGFALAAVLCLALGVGLVGAMYSQVQSNVLRPVPGVGDAHELVRFHRPISYPYFESLLDRTGPFDRVAAYMGPVPVVVGHEDRQAERVWGQIVTPDYFTVLGARLAHGRAFDPQDHGAAVAVISHRYWQRTFGGRSAVGRTVRLNGHAVTLIGIGAPDFLGAAPTTSAADVWIPTTAPYRVAPELSRMTAPYVPAFDVIGRLASDVTVAQAEAELDPAVRQLEMAAGDPRRDRPEVRVRLLPGGRMLPVRDEDLPRAIGFPLALVSLVLLMACSNTANMQLARSAARRGEIALRLSLGAGPGRVIRQLLTESAVLTVAGGAAGALIGLALLAAFASMAPMLPEYGHYSVDFDWRAFAAATGLAGAFVAAFGLAPARRAGRLDISLALKRDGSPSGGRRRLFTLSNVLVFQQVAASVLLLLLTAFVVIGWRRATSVEPGFRPAGLYLARFDPVRDGHTADEARQFTDRLLDRLRGLPQATDAAAALTLPPALATNEAMLNAQTEFVAGPQSLGTIRTEHVGAGFFRTIGTPIVRGREFTTADERSGAATVVVSAALAARLWPEQDAVGQVVELDGQRLDVIGVAGDLKAAFPLAPTTPAAYRPLSAGMFAEPSNTGVVVLVRLGGADAVSTLRRQSELVDPTVTLFGVAPVAAELENARFLATFATTMYGGMGVFGLALASVGLASVTAHAVARRRREIGIRIALGARRWNVLWLVLRDSSVIVAAGTATGLVLAVLATRALSSVLETLAETTETTLTDPVILLGGPALLALLAFLACYLPARTSTRIDPSTALRAE